MAQRASNVTYNQFQFQLKGFNELLQKLQKIPVEWQNKTAWKAAYMASNQVRKDARSRVRVKTGLLKKELRVARLTQAQMKKRSRRGLAQQGTHIYAIGTFSKKVKGKKTDDAFYGRFVELGTGPHYIRARRDAKGRFSALKLPGGFRQKVHHPGSRPYPFLGPAMDVATNVSTHEG